LQKEICVNGMERVVWGSEEGEDVLYRFEDNL
jgi:hypothetical protein